jgi:hypothetical protein
MGGDFVCLHQMVEDGIIHCDVVSDRGQLGRNLLPWNDAMTKIDYRYLWKSQGRKTGFDVVLPVNDIWRRVKDLDIVNHSDRGFRELCRNFP